MTVTLGFKITENGRKYKVNRTPEDRPVIERDEIKIYIEDSPGSFNHVETIEFDITENDSQDCWELAEEAIEFHSGSEVTKERKKF